MLFATVATRRLFGASTGLPLPRRAPARTDYVTLSCRGNGSRVGRTITAPADDDPRPVAFAFVSCQNINEGFQHALRRMIWEDERRPPAEQLGFVLHLGDFIYEVIQYPEEVATRYDRTIVEIVRLPESIKVGNFHLPLDLAGYRAIYRAYLRDPDIQDARARWPFVAMWDNHEFSWQGRQSLLKAGRIERPAQTVKVPPPCMVRISAGAHPKTAVLVRSFDPPRSPMYRLRVR